MRALPMTPILRSRRRSFHRSTYKRMSAKRRCCTRSTPERDGGALKAASYEIRPGGAFVLWKEGKKQVQRVTSDGDLVLPANSISFVQLESTIRLPHYIAMRFNLRIKHVHRGIRLGTGPLVDPGYRGQLLIPLHNLTAEDYRIRGSEGLIWAEFTKTSWSAGEREADPDAFGEDFRPTDPKKTDLPVEMYFEKANQNRPIESSIPDAISTAKSLAVKASADAEIAKKANGFFAGVGVLAILALLISLASFLQTADTNLRAASEKALLAEQDAKHAGSEVGALLARVKVLEDLKIIIAADRRGSAVRLSEADAQIVALSTRLNKLEELIQQIANVPRDKTNGNGLPERKKVP